MRPNASQHAQQSGLATARGTTNQHRIASGGVERGVGQQHIAVGQRDGERCGVQGVDACVRGGFWLGMLDNFDRQHLVLKTRQAQGGGLPRGQAAVVADEPTERLLHLTKRRRNLHQLTQLNRATEVARRRHQHGEHHCGLAVARVKPGVAFLHAQQAHKVVQHLRKALLQRQAFYASPTV